MKKLICFSFLRSKELLQAKRLVYQYSAGEQQEPMETTVDLASKMDALKKKGDGEGKDMDDQSAVHNGVAGQIDKYIDGQKALLKKTREKTEEKDRKNFPTDEEFSNALETAKANALKKIDDAWTAANAKREENSKAFAQTKSMVIAARAKETEDKGAFAEEKTKWHGTGIIPLIGPKFSTTEVDEGWLHQKIGKVDFALGTAVSGPKISYRVNGENKTERWQSGNLDKAVTEALKVIYKEQGKDAADAKVDEMIKASTGFGNRVGMSELGQILNVNGVNALTYAGDNEMLGDAAEFDQKQVGRIWGLAYAANAAFGDNEAGKKGLADYTQYVHDAVVAVNKSKTKDQASAVDGLMTPTEWAMKNNKEALKGYKENATANVSELILSIGDTKSKNKLNGIWTAIQDAESDQGKQNLMFQDFLGKLGIADADALAKLKPEELEKLLKEKNANVYGDAPDKLDGLKGDDKEANKAINMVKDRLQGYLSGLEVASDGKEFKDGDYDYSDRVRSEYRDYIKRVSSSTGPDSKMADITTKMGPVLQQTDLFNQVKRDALYGFLNEAKAGIKTPNQFFEDFKAKEKERYTGVSEAYVKQEKYVNYLVDSLPAEKTKEHDYLRGILIAAVGRETDPQKMKDAANAALKELGVDPTKLGEADYDKNFKKFVDARRDLTDNGKKMDDMSKGLAVGLIYAAEQKFKDDPNKDKILASYKEYLKGKMDTLGKDEDTQEKVAELKRQQSLLKNTTDSETRKNILTTIAKLQSPLYLGSWNAMGWPDTFKKDFDVKDVEDRKKLLEENKKFLSDYAPEKLTDDSARGAINTILSAIPKDKADANKDAIAAKKTALLAEVDALKTKKGKDLGNAYLQILAKAQDYAGTLDEKDHRYLDGSNRYITTARILEVSGNQKESVDYVTKMGKAMGLDEKTGTLKDALDKVKAASPDERAAIIAAQIEAILKVAPADKKGDLAFEKTDFDDYRDAAEKNKQAQAKKPAKKAGSGGGGGMGGGTPSGGGGGMGGGGGSRRRPGETPGSTPETKEKPMMDEKGYIGILTQSLTNILASYKTQSIEFNPAATSTKIKGALDSAIDSAARGSNLKNIVGKNFTATVEGVTTSSGPSKSIGDSYTTFSSYSGVEAWVEKNMKAKEGPAEIADENAAAQAADAAAKGVLSKYDAMSFENLQKNGVGTVEALNAKISQEVPAAVMGLALSKDLTLSKTYPLSGGFSFMYEKGNFNVTLSPASMWARGVIERAQKKTETDTNIAAANAYLKSQYPTLIAHSGEDQATFNNAAIQLISSALNGKEIADGFQTVVLNGHNFVLTIKDKKVTYAAGDFPALKLDAIHDRPPGYPV